MKPLFKPSRLKLALNLASGGAILASSIVPSVGFASSWDPSLLVNTESFVEIDDGDGTTDIQLFFGPTESIDYNVTTDSFDFSKGINVTGTVTGSSLVGTDLAGCINVTSDANGKLICDDLSGLDSQYVNTAGDTMTGALFVESTISASGALATEEGLTLNADGTADTATLTFGGSASQTLSYATTQFVFSDDVQVNGNLDVNGNSDVSGNSQVTGDLNVDGATTLDETTVDGTFNATGNADFDANVNVDGTLDVTGAATLSSTLDVTGAGTFGGDLATVGNLSGNSLTVDTGTINLNGVTYNVTNSQGAADTVLVNDGAGNLTWQSSAIANSSGSFMSLHPEYANATYKADGSDNVGQLKTDVIANQNYYVWNTSKGTAQDYDIYVRVQVPENFDSWSNIEVQHNNAGVATVKADLIDTAGATQAGSATGGVGVITLTPSGTYTAGEYMTVKLTVSATSAGDARVGYLNLNWVTTTP